MGKDSGKNHKAPEWSHSLAQTVLNSLSAHIAILDASGTIVETNQAWRRYAAEGKMAGILNVSAATVNFHRKNLRKKFNISNTRQNLRAYLLSLG
ncbi:MAG: LuxR C-terminal-related transcriptional regulator [Desulfobacterales bacterium]|nr:LuxR C-terminal-related transcriptional regulator [Desulfobacterales bacterium]